MAVTKAEGGLHFIYADLDYIPFGHFVYSGPWEDGGTTIGFQNEDEVVLIPTELTGGSEVEV